MNAEPPTSAPPVPQVGKPVTNVNVSPASGSVIVKLYVFVCPSSAVVGGLAKATVGAVFAATTVMVGCAAVLITVATLELPCLVSAFAAAVGQMYVAGLQEAVAVNCTVTNSPLTSRLLVVPPPRSSRIPLSTSSAVQPALFPPPLTIAGAEMAVKQTGSTMNADCTLTAPLVRVTRTRNVADVPVVTDGEGVRSAPPASRKVALYCGSASAATRIA